MADGFDIHEFTNFEKSLLRLANDTMPKETRKHLQSQGTKLKKVTLAKAKSKVKKGKGDYYKSIKRGKVYKYNDALSIRCYSSDPKAHLLENGHRQVAKDGQEIGFVPGYHVFEEAEKEYQSTFYNETEKFIDSVIDKGL
jgi:hypothetical protein